MSEPYFVSHCDEGCGLGSLRYECPCCKKWCTEYGEAWFEHDSGRSVDGLVMKCEHCKKPILLRQKDWDLSVEEAKSVTLFIIVIKHNENSFQVHMHNGEIWHADTEQHAKEWGANVQSEFPEATIQIVKVDGPPGKTLEEVKKHMLDELRKLTRSGPDASPFV